MYDGAMNIATATRRAPRSIPTEINFDLIPEAQASAEELVPVGLHANERISVRLINFRGELSSYGHNFTVGSVASYAARYHEDTAAAVARSEARGEDLYYAISEGIVVTAHRQEPVKRREVELGTIIEIDDRLFQVLQAPNDNLRFVPMI